MPAINRTAGRLLAVASILAASAALTRAATIVASDSAAAPVYLDGNGWATGDNGGTGFGPWSLAGSDHSGFFDYTSTQNGDGDSNGDGDIDSPGGHAWGLYANSGATADANRGFASVLSVGKTFTLDMDNGWIDDGDRVGVALTNGAGQSRFEFYFRGGRSFYTFSDGTGAEQSAGNVGFTDEGLHLTFTVLPGDNYAASVTPRGGAQGYIWTGHLAGDAFSGITGVRLFNENAGFDAPRNAYFNNMAVSAVPLPAAALGAAPLLGLLACGRARRKGQ